MWTTTPEPCSSIFGSRARSSRTAGNRFWLNARCHSSPPTTWTMMSVVNRVVPEPFRQCRLCHPKAITGLACRDGQKVPIGEFGRLQRPQTRVENVGTFCARHWSIDLSKMLNQQFGKDSHLSLWVVPRWSENEDPSFRERIAIH